MFANLFYIKRFFDNFFNIKYLIKPTNYEFAQEGYLLCQSIDVYYFTYILS
jgi:hypothetical protein